MEKKYRIGVIGLGMGLNMFAANDRDYIPMEVTHICGVPEQKEMMNNLQSKYSLKHCTYDYMDIVNDPEIDVVGVFSPDALHFEQCKALIEAGKHIICTKPLMVSLKEVQDTVKLVDKMGTKFLVGQTMRYESQFIALKTMFDAGDLGNVFMADSQYVHDMSPVFKMTPWRGEMPQDLIYGGLCHPMDALRWFFGDIEEVHAFGAESDRLRGPISGKPYGDMSNYIVNLKFKNGVIARCFGAYGIVHPPLPEMSITLFGEKGSATSEFNDYLGGKVKVVLDKFEMKNEFVSNYAPEKAGTFGHERAVVRYLEHFSECLINDTDPQPDVREGAKAIAACSAAYESMKTGKVVKVFNEF